MTTLEPLRTNLQLQRLTGKCEWMHVWYDVGCTSKYRSRQDVESVEWPSNASAATYDMIFRSIWDVRICNGYEVSYYTIHTKICAGERTYLIPECLLEKQNRNSFDRKQIRSIFQNSSSYIRGTRRFCSAGGRSLTRKKWTKCERMKRRERSMVLGANWRLANAKSSMVHENNPDAACMGEIERTERRAGVQATLSHQLYSCFVNGPIFCRPSRFRFLRSVWKQRAV